MMSLKRVVIDGETGEQRIEEISAEEAAQVQASLNIRLLEEDAKIAAKESARAKLAALGLTDEEISAIVGG
jgi:hypothetical protein